MAPSAFWPELPTAHESGLPNYCASIWFGIFAPEATPAAVVKQVNAVVGAVLAETETRQWLEDQGFLVVGNSSEVIKILIHLSDGAEGTCYTVWRMRRQMSRSALWRG